MEGYLQYCGGITAVHVGDSFNTVGIPSVLCRLFSTVGIRSVQWGIASVLWKVFSTFGVTSVQWVYLQYFGVLYMQGDNISTVEVAQYSGDKT